MVFERYRVTRLNVYSGVLARSGFVAGDCYFYVRLVLGSLVVGDQWGDTF